MTDFLNAIDIIIAACAFGAILGFIIGKRNRTPSDFTGGEFPQDHK